MFTAVNERFKYITEFTEDNKQFILAAVTNPKFKLSWVPAENKNFVWDMFFSEYRKQSAQIETNANSPEKRSNEFDLFADFLNNDNQNVNDPSITVCEYLKNSQTDLLMLKSYPVILELYIKYNTTMSSSASVERLFSQALIVFTPRRNRLNATTFERILFVKHNKTLLPVN